MALPPGRRLIALAAGAALALATSPATAGGFEVPDNGSMATARGGAFSVRADDLTALIHNPGGLSRFSGTGILLNNNLMWKHVTFQRSASQAPETVDYGYDPLLEVENTAPLFPLGVVFGVASDFGLDDWTFALGVYGPSASGDSAYPIHGGQKYMLTELQSRVLYLSAAVAWGQADHFGIGLTLQYAMAPIVKMQMVVDGSPFGVLNPYYSGNDVESVMVLSDMTSFSAIIGGWWRITDAVEVAVSGRVVPVFFDLKGKAALHNVPEQTQFTDDRLHITDSKAEMDLTLPPTARAGIRYRHLDDAGEEVFDIELNLVYEAWSMMQAYRVEMEGQINLFAGAEAPDVVIEKNWKDTFSVRMGGTWRVLADTLRLSLGGYWESGAVPDNYEHLDYLSFDRFGLGFGVSSRLGPVDLTLAYSHVFQEDRSVSEKHGKVYQIRPLDPCPESCDGGAGWSGIPANAGTFESGYDILSLGVQVVF